MSSASNTLGCAAASAVWGASVASEWQVASIEIHRPSLDSITTEAPADVASVDVRKSEPASKQ